MIGMLFRLPALVYLILAPVAIALGIWGYFAVEADDAARAKALSHAPPAAVALERFDPARNKSDYDEVVIDGQLDVAKIVDVTKTKGSRTVGQVTVAPLYGTEAKDTAGGMRAVLVYDDKISDEMLKSMIRSNGPFGPVIRVDGVLTTDSGLINDARNALASHGGAPENAMFVKPFVEGRSNALKSSDGGSWGALIAGLVAAVVLGAYGLFRMRNA